MAVFAQRCTCKGFTLFKWYQSYDSMSKCLFFFARLLWLVECVFVYKYIFYLNWLWEVKVNCTVDDSLQVAFILSRWVFTVEWCLLYLRWGGESETSWVPGWPVGSKSKLRLSLATAFAGALMREREREREEREKQKEQMHAGRARVESKCKLQLLWALVCARARQGEDGRRGFRLLSAPRLWRRRLLLHWSTWLWSHQPHFHSSPIPSSWPCVRRLFNLSSLLLSPLPLPVQQINCNNWARRGRISFFSWTRTLTLALKTCTICSGHRLLSAHLWHFYKKENKNKKNKDFVCRSLCTAAATAVFILSRNLTLQPVAVSTAFVVNRVLAKTTSELFNGLALNSTSCFT